MFSPWAGAGAALDGRRLFDLADARKIVDARWKHDDEHFARALANAPRLDAVIPQAEGVDSAWRPVGTATLAAPSWDPWAPLDPHDAGNTAPRPFRKGRTYATEEAVRIVSTVGVGRMVSIAGVLHAW